jgi:hypothetical protein
VPRRFTKRLPPTLGSPKFLNHTVFDLAIANLLCQQHRTATTRRKLCSAHIPTQTLEIKRNIVPPSLATSLKMGLIERVSEALTSTRWLYRSGLQFLATGNATVHNEPAHESAVNCRLSDDSGHTTGDTEVIVQSTTPRSGSKSHSKDGLDKFEAHHAIGDVHGNIQSLDDASSNADSEDSWAFESPPLDLNYEALKHIGTYFIPGSHGRCTGISTLQRGQFHEIRVLHFEDGWTCIGRFTREAEPLAKVESDSATIEYVRNNTTIPVPEIYLVNNPENHVVDGTYPRQPIVRHVGSPVSGSQAGYDHTGRQNSRPTCGPRV